MIVIDKHSSIPLYLQIYNQIRQEILDGVLKENQILTGSRELAKTLEVSRNTVDGAYHQLAAEGYIGSRKGIGCQVLKVPTLKTRDMGQKRAQKTAFPRSSHQKSELLYDLTNSSHTSDLFPKNLWRRYTLECLDLLDREKRLSSGQETQGERYLRQNLLNYLERIRGVSCEEEQIIITSGIQQSLEIVCKLLPDGKRTILMEEPGYHKAAAVFRNNGLSIRAVPIDENGIDPGQFTPEPGLGAVYTTPSHQFPTGVTLPIGRRHELLRWAGKTDTYIVEDDFDSELRYYTKPIPSLQSIDTEHRVIYLGTFSKALSPTIRMGYLILPPALLARYQILFKDYNSTVPLLNQYVVGRLIETEQYDRHVRRLNNIFKRRLEAFLAEFADVREKIKLSGNGTGQYFLLEFSEKADQQELIRLALAQGVRVYSTMQFWQDQTDCPPNTLFLGFSKIDVKDIPDCVSRLKQAWSAWL